MEFTEEKIPYENFRNYFVCISIVIAMFWGALYEGVRFQQYPYILAYFVICFMIMIKYHSYIVLSCYTAILFLTIVNNVIYGESCFTNMNLIGPYQVGHMDIHTKDGSAVSVFYPMDKSMYNQQIKKGRKNSNWFRYGNKSLRGIAIASADIGDKSHPPPWVFSHFKTIKMNTVQNGKVSRDFDKRSTNDLKSKYERLTQKKLIPVILCHGLSGNRTS